MRLDLAGRPGHRRSPLAPRRRERSNRFVAAALGAAAALVDRGARRPGGPPAGPARRHGVRARGDHAPGGRQPGLRRSRRREGAAPVLRRRRSPRAPWSSPTAAGFLMAHELPGLDGDRTYQLWGDTGAGSLVSLGLLGDDPATDRVPGRHRPRGPRHHRRGGRRRVPVAEPGRHRRRLRLIAEPDASRPGAGGSSSALAWASVPPLGLEPRTCGLRVRRSDQLS